MKVTVTFNTVKIVVPCGDGEKTVRELTQLATIRYKKATGKPRLSWVSVHSLKAKEGGILDPDDRLVDVCDDREQLIAFYDEEGIPQGGDGMSASSDESETVPPGGFRSNDIEVSGDYDAGAALQVRRGSEPALNKLEQEERVGRSGDQGDQQNNKRWSAAGLVINNRDSLRASKTDLSVIDETSFYGDTNFDPGGGRISPLPPPFERGQGSGAARDSDRPTPFSRDANRLSIQIGYEEGRWLDAADIAGGFPPPPQESDYQSVRREPLGGSSPPQDTRSGNGLINMVVQHIVIQNEIGPLGIHVVPSGDPTAAGLLIQGIEQGGRIDRDGRLAVNDMILEINGYPLVDIPFHKAQEIFKEALFAKELQLVVEKNNRADKPDLVVLDNEMFSQSEGESGTLGRRLGSGPGSKVTSTVQAANTRKIGRKLVVNLVKGVNGLGFSITTRDIQAGGVTPIYVKNILPKGAAIENGQLRPGDRLLEVNEESMDGKSQSEVVGILRNVPQLGEVNLVVSRQEKVEELEAANTLELKGRSQSGKNKQQIESPGNLALQTETESEEYTSVSPDVSVNSNGEVIFPWKHREILTLDIPVHDTERAGLGVSVKGKTTGGGAKGIVDLGIFVKSVIHGGAASRDGRLKTNDQLVNINGISLLGKANCDAMDTLRRAMHEEGPTPGVITLTVARRLVVAPGEERTPGSRSVRQVGGRESVTSILTTSSDCEDGSYREYRVNTSNNFDNSNPSNDTVIYIENPSGRHQSSSAFDNFIPPAPRNPVVERLMGRKEKMPDPSGIRNESYYRATGHDTFNSTMIQQMSDSPDGGLTRTEGVPFRADVGSSRHLPLKSPTVHQFGQGETVMIEQFESPTPKRRPHSPDGCEKEQQSDTTHASQLSLETEDMQGFARDQPGRQSMSEKRHATLDAKSTDTYQRSKKARQEREMVEKGDGVVGPMLGMKKSSSLESLQTMMTELKMEEGRPVQTTSRNKTSRVVRGGHCNESFRAAVDRSYDAQGEEVEDDQPDAEVMETFDRAEYRQSGSSLDSNNDFKKKKNGKLFKGFGIFKFSKQRAKSTDGSGRVSQQSDRKTPTTEMRQTPTDELGWKDNEEARANLVAEQARIQQRYKRLVQQKQETDEKTDLVEEVYQGVDQAPVPRSGDGTLPASLATARPGSRSGITGTPTDPRFANYEEIQRHLSRRQAQYHSQRRDHPARSDRPVSNFYEYESVQAAGGGQYESGGSQHSRQWSQASGGSSGREPLREQYGSTHHQTGLPVYSATEGGRRSVQHPDIRQEMPPPPRPRDHGPPSHSRDQGPSSQSKNHGQSRDHGPSSQSRDHGPPSQSRDHGISPQSRDHGPSSHTRDHGPPSNPHIAIHREGQTYGRQSLAVAPLSSKYNQFSGQQPPGSRDYEDHRTLVQQEFDPSDPYGRIMFRGGKRNSQIPSGFQGGHHGSHSGGQPHLQQQISGSRVQSQQVPKNIYIPSLPPGSKV